MLPLQMGSREANPARLLMIGAHSDDIEIGCGGTILKLVEQGAISAICWVVLSGNGERGAEAEASAHALLNGAVETRVIVRDFKESFFPYDGGEIKGFFETLKHEFSPDIIFTHQRQDLHQDHRLSCELTWNAFRDHLILEYEVPKYDGDMGSPNLFVPLEDDVCRRKVEHLLDHFASQRDKRWFREDLFSGPLAAARDGVPVADFVRRGLLLPQGRPGVTLVLTFGSSTGGASSSSSDSSL
jgi:LmbE family N-acetylglucosaminyl deacetylase